MDYKVFARNLRIDAQDQSGRLDRQALETDLEEAADAIEALLAERGAVEEHQAVYRAALDKWGARMQTVVAIEELSELQKELCKSIRGDGLTSHIAEEIADVSIMLEQMTLLNGVQDAEADWKKSKLERLERRVKGEAG